MHKKKWSLTYSSLNIADNFTQTHNIEVIKRMKTNRFILL